MRARAFSFLIFLFASAVNGQSSKTYESLSAVLWTQTAVERSALTRQTYRSAEQALRRALEDPHWTAALEQTSGFDKLAPAVILDLDETVLDNSALRARLTLDGKSYSGEVWAKWVAAGQAAAVPGAVEFLKFAQMEGVAAFYITNRVCDAASVSDPTVAVLRNLSIPFQEGRLLCKAKETDSPDKSARRTKVAAAYRVLLLIGDDFNDFLTAPSDRAAREYLLKVHERFFGDRWFLLPNPMYGSWEGAAGYELPAKLDALRPWKPAQ